MLFSSLNFVKSLYFIYLFFFEKHAKETQFIEMLENQSNDSYKGLVKQTPSILKI